MTVDIAYVGAKGIGGYARVDVNAHDLGGVIAAGHIPSLGRHNRIESWGQRFDSRYNSLQIALNRPFTRGFMFKGAYTLSKSMNESTMPMAGHSSWNTPTSWIATGPRPGSTAATTSRWGLRTLPWQSGGSYEGILSAIVPDWQISGTLVRSVAPRLP